MIDNHHELSEFLDKLGRQTFVVQMPPRSAPRPIRSRGRIMNPPWYTEYKQIMADKMREAFAENGWPVVSRRYIGMMLTSYFPYPKAFKGEREEGAPVGTTPGDAIKNDTDNLAKAPMDVMQSIGLVGNDSAFSIIIPIAARTNLDPRIKITLYYIP